MSIATKLVASLPHFEMEIVRDGTHIDVLSTDDLLRRNLKALQVLSEICPPSTAALTEIEKALAQMERVSPRLNFFHGERFKISHHPLSEELTYSDADETLKTVYRCLPPIRNLDQAAFLNRWRELLVEFNKYPFESAIYKDAALRSEMQTLIQFNQPTGAVEYTAEKAHVVFLRYHAFPEILLFHRYETYEIIALAKVARVSLSVQHYSRENGSWPQSLDVLGLESLTDPFTGEDVRYEPLEDGFVVFSGGIRSLGPGKSDYSEIAWHFPSGQSYLGSKPRAYIQEEDIRIWEEIRSARSFHPFIPEDETPPLH